jgi:16S rRNA (uracil1498-N3)-methyltransferase
VSPPLFLVDEVPAADRHRLDGPEGHHAAAVLRLRAGEVLLLADGRGASAVAVVTAVGRDHLDVAVRQRWTTPPPDPRITVVQGIAKGERGELAVQAMTEVGVDEIVPWAAARSVVRWQGERGDRSLHRWRVTAREAAKQARRVWLPTVTRPMSTVDVTRCLADVRTAFVLHEEADARLSTVELPDRGSLAVVVGPEGGIDQAELAAFEAAGAVPVRLGDTVLRTSTAGVAALSVLAARLGRW